MVARLFTSGFGGKVVIPTAVEMFVKQYCFFLDGFHFDVQMYQVVRLITGVGGGGINQFS